MSKIAKWRNYSDEELMKIIASSTSFRSLAMNLGYKSGGAIQDTLKEYIEEKHIDISHFSGQNWNKENFDYSRFQNGKAIKSRDMKNALIHLRGNQCECCQQTKWLDRDIPLEVHHKDGEHLNNDLSNLILLCPNCHALTDNWRGKNINKGIKIVSDEDFVKALKENVSIRKALLSLGLTGAGGNYERAYQLINEYQIEHLKKNK